MMRPALNRLAAVLLVFVMVLGGPAAAGPLRAEGPESFIRALAERAITIVSSDRMPYDQRLERLRELFLQGFDVPLIARFALGASWRRASASQRQEYLELFEEVIVQTYLRRFREFADVEFKVNGTTRRGENDYYVNSSIHRRGEPAVEVTWRVRARNERGYKIIDVVAEGMSMALAQRDDFSSVIRRNGGQVEGLLEVLREKIAEAQKTEHS